MIMTKYTLRQATYRAKLIQNGGGEKLFQLKKDDLEELDRLKKVHGSYNKVLSFLLKHHKETAT